MVTLGPAASLAGGVFAIAFSPDGRTLAGPGPDAGLVLYAVETGLPIFQFESQLGAVLRLAWSPDGRILVGAISTHIMRIWDARDGHLMRKIFGSHEGPVAGVAFSPDGRTIASASFDHTVKLWTPTTRSDRVPYWKDTPTKFAPWPSAQTAHESFRPASTRPSGSGMPGRAQSSP